MANVLSAPVPVATADGPGTPLAGPARPGPGRRSLRRRVSVGFTLTVVLLVIGAALAAIGLVGASHDRTRLLDRVDPAIQRVDAYETALVDESAAAHLYAEAGGTGVLASYRNAGRATATARAELAASIATLPAVRARVSGIDRMVASWRSTYLAVLVARPGPSRLGRNLAFTTAASVAFSGIRGRFAATAAYLLRLRAGAVRGFDDALNLLFGVVIAVFIGIVFLVLAIWLGVRHSVLAPLAAVGADSRTVTAGALDHPVAAVGPVEIASLAHDIDAMRSRIVEDLHALEAAHTSLAAQRQALEERGLELSRSNRDLEQFAYVASHDLQEPLRKVAAFCQLLSDRYHDQLDDTGRQYIDFAVDGAKRMQALVNDLLGFSRVGRTDERWARVDLGRAVLDALSNLEARIEASGATVEVPADLPMVRGDASLLTALFQNLVGNALKFRGDDAPEVRISCAADGDAWELRVTDNGIGIEPRYAERVFVIFQRLHARDRYEGTGIGLALCRKIIEFHGGQIGVEPGHAQGTTIRFTLPVADDNDPEESDG